MRARAREARAPVRIAINGIFLDEVSIALPRQKNTIALLSFPPDRHWARFDSVPDHLVLGVQPPTLTQRYFDGVIPVDRAIPVTIRVGDSPPREFVIERLEASDRFAGEDVMVLHLRPVADPVESAGRP
jgi:hypothetical protein